jgi:hypothetical protein
MDTKPIINLPERIRGFDILIHEATADRTLEGKANKFGHSTAAQAATIAKEADVKRLFLVHISPRYRDPRPLIEEAKEVFEETFLPSDLDEFEVPLPESWEEDDRIDQIVGEAKEDEEEAAEGEAVDGAVVLEGMPTEEAELADATEVYDEVSAEEVAAELPTAPPIPTEVTAEAMADGGEAAPPVVEAAAEPEQAPAPAPEPEPEPEPAITAEGISLGAVAAAMESKTSRPDEDESAPATSETSDEASEEEEEEDDEFDLEAAMKEVGLDPNS